MATSTIENRYRINGLVDTKQSVISNLERICNSCGSFLSYDIHEGKWGVIVNRAESTVAKAFDDSNIVGSIQVSGTGLTNLYNSVRVEYPLRDTSDTTDFVEIALASGDRYANEPDNTLQLRLDMVNEPVQAQIIGLIELKQNRLDKIVTFASDYSTLNLNAGDIITVTNDLYQFTNKKFRVITLTEVDSDDGQLLVEVTALEYDDDVYDTSDLSRYIRSDRTGIRSIGSIGEPNEPQITVFEADSRPRLSVEAVVPDGIVESMELWLSSDNSTFTRVETEYHPGGGTFTSGDTIVFDYDKVNSQDIYVKVRGMNSTTTGPFSDTASYLAFVPQQTTDAIGSNTAVLDDAGDDILSLLGANGLLILLNQLMENNSTGSGSIFDQLFALFNNETGYDILNDFSGSINSVAPSNLLTHTQNDLISLIADATESGGTWSGTWTQRNLFSFTAPVTGNYKVRFFTRYGNSVGAAATQTFIGTIATVRTGSYYSGSLGNASTPTGTSSAAIVSGAIDYDVDTQYRSSQYDNTQLERFYSLTAGVTYYVNGFHISSAAADSITTEISELYYVG